MRIKKILSSTSFSVIAFVLAAGLLIFSSVSGARAALTIQSTDYQGEISLDDIGVTLTENGIDVSTRDYNNSNEDFVSWSTAQGVLLADMLKEDGELKLGKKYDEKLAVRNSGTINEFVRVSVYKYWVDENKNKLRSLDPGYIDIQFKEGNGWVLDEKSSTPERTVMYYEKRLDVGESTPEFTSTLTINPDAAVEVSHTDVVKKDGFTTFTTTYKYDTKTFVLEATVDAVQDHHADHAIPSAWGVKLSGFTQDGDSVSSVQYGF